MQLTDRDHHVTLQHAAGLTGTYRSSPAGRAQGAITGGLFKREIIDAILAQPGCDGLRYYHGVDAVGAPVIVLVGVTNGNEDLWQGIIGEEAYPCPPVCAMPNPLNQ